jgi:hypothetical protein
MAESEGSGEGSSNAAPPPVISDTEGRITSIIIIEENLGEGCKLDLPHYLSGIAAVAPWVHFKSITSTAYNSDTRLGGILGNQGCRIWTDVPDIVGIHGIYNVVEHLPFSENYDKVIIAQIGGEILEVDLSTLSCSEKLFKAWELEAGYGSFNCELASDGHLIWMTHSEGGTLTIKGKDLFPISQFGNDWKQVLESVQQFWHRRWMDWDARLRTCELHVAILRSNQGRVRNVPVELWRMWAQDLFVVRQLNKRNILSVLWGIKARNSVLESLRHIIPEKKSEFVWGGHEEKLETQGGNMHRSDNLLFIGKDELRKYGLTSETASSTLLRLAMNGVKSAQVIWIGTDKKGDDLISDNHTFQPAFHTDLFYCPLGFFENPIGDEKVFRYIFAMPASEWVWPSVGDGDKLPLMVNALIERYRETRDRIQKDLESIGITSERIDIPLPIHFKYKKFSNVIDWRNVHPKSDIVVHSVWAFANGLVNESNGQREFWMPEYESGVLTPQIIPVAFREAKDRIEAKDRFGNRIKVKPILGVQYQPQQREALRCKVKVLERS